MRNPSPSSLLRKVGVAGSAGTLATGSVAALLAALAATAAPAAAASTFVVDDASDGAPNAADCITPVVGSCSLRDAAAAAVDGDTVVFASGISAITIADGGSGGTILFNAITLTGPGAASLTVDTAFAPTDDDAFYFSGTGNVTVSGLTLKGRMATQNSGAFEIDDVVIDGSAGSAGGAAYFWNSGNVIVSNSEFKNNVASGNGGALYFRNSGNATVSDSTFTTNKANGGGGGGAIYVSSDVKDFTIERSSLTGNVALQNGGAMVLYNYGNTVIDASYLYNNEATQGSGGGVYAATGGTVLIRTSTFDANYANYNGGGLYLGSKGIVTILSSTISNNTASLGNGGGIVLDEQNLEVTNSTITGNHAENGGALHSKSARVSLIQSTVTANNSYGEGGGIVLTAPTIVMLSGTILAGNFVGNADAAPADRVQDDITADDTTTVTSNHSMLGSIGGTIANVSVTDSGGTIRSADPQVAALADNGGPTKTLALLPGSAAIDAGPNPVEGFPGSEYDQRGVGFPRVVNGMVDIGAFEVQPSDPRPDPVVPSFTG